MEYTVHEAKTQFSKLLAAVARGEQVVITSGRSRKPIAKLTRVEGEVSQRLGFAKDVLPDIPDSFWDTLPEDELRLWNGEGD